MASATTAKTTSKKTTKTGSMNGASGAFAVIATGGKQYRVSVGQTIGIEIMKGNAKDGGKGDLQKGDSVTFDKVLFTDDGTTSVIGTPFIDGKKVMAEVVSIGRLPKVIVIKYKQKSRYFKKNGHRQPVMKVKITTI